MELVEFIGDCMLDVCRLITMVMEDMSVLKYVNM